MTDRNCNSSIGKKATSTKKLTQDEFIRRCVEKHGGAYDYSKSKYITTSKNVEIICKKCNNSFFQLPPNHWKGYRCFHCYGRRRFTKEQFVAKSVEAHGLRYDYSNTKYKNNREKVIIACPIHGNFSQSPDSHMHGKGCEKCAAITRGKAQRVGFSEYKKRCSEKHNDKYTYDENSFTTLSDKTSVKCPEHGWFEQDAKAHMHGKGCRQCGFKSSGFDRSRFKRVCKKNNNGNGIFYVIKCKNDKEVFFKIGITSRSIEERYKSKGHIPYDYEALYSITDNSDYIHKLEVRIHALLKKHHYTPSLNFKGSVYECFTVIKPVEKLLEELSTTEQLQLLA